MAKIDRSKYRASNSKEMQSVSEEIKSRQVTRGEWIKIEPGINTIRLFPAPLKAKSSLFCYPKVVSFLPFLVDEKNKKGEKTGKQVEKRKPVFNAKVHGELEHDIVEEYLAAAREKFSAQTSDKREIFNLLKPLTDWRSGIKPSTAWMAYAYKLIGDKKQYGRLQITDGVHKQMDTLCLREGEAGKPIVVDLFSHPDTGKAIQWQSDPTNEDPKAKNKISILFEKDLKLKDEELEMLEDWPSLESLYSNAYKAKDFELQLKGLQFYDKKNSLGIFESPAFQSIIETCKAEIEKKFGVSDEETYEDKFADEDTDNDITEENKIPEVFESMDKATLKVIVEDFALPIEVKVTTPPSKLREEIYEAMIAQYELSGSNEEIEKAIVDILESSEEEDMENEEDSSSDLMNKYLSK